MANNLLNEKNNGLRVNLDKAIVTIKRLHSLISEK